MSTFNQILTYTNKYQQGHPGVGGELATVAGHPQALQYYRQRPILEKKKEVKLCATNAPRVPMVGGAPVTSGLMGGPKDATATARHHQDMPSCRDLNLNLLFFSNPKATMHCKELYLVFTD